MMTLPEYPTFVTHLECGLTGEKYPAEQLHNLSRAGKPLLVRYALSEIKQAYRAVGQETVVQLAVHEEGHVFDVPSGVAFLESALKR